MSLLIKGMNMPKCCCDCFLYDSAGFCALDQTREFENYNHKRPDDCTLVEIPKPHGRLIDADELMKVIEANDYTLRSYYNTTDRGMFTIGIKQAIDEAPTIIEAEG